ncbi:MAG: hypothetical protein II970_04855 [Paludibacteraceae bacterium]|nr:hypothetical protein [Paludibacteraceae bacterium]
MHRRLRSIIILMFLGAGTVCAQKFLYDVDFILNFDNREIHNNYEPSGTIFGFRLTPTIGVGLSDSLGGSHRLMAGASYLQPCGADWRHVKVTPTVFYHYGMRGFEMHVGFVPYNELGQALPDYLRSDSLAFYYPNIQGALFQYKSKHGYAMALCDWRGMMSHETREAFRIVGGGRYEHKCGFYAGGYAQMNHLSHNADSIHGVCDDLLFNPLVGVNLAKYTPLDSLTLQAGYLCGFQRDRRAHREQWCHGFHAALAIGWRFIGFRNELYAGQNQMPLYGKYGVVLNQGDPRYQAELYNRTDLYFYIVRRSFVTCWAGWSLLVTDKGTVSNQQQVVCRFNLDGLLHHPEKKKIRTLSWR